jgi:hypothetical protein
VIAPALAIVVLVGVAVLELSKAPVGGDIAMKTSAPLNVEPQAMMVQDQVGTSPEAANPSLMMSKSMAEAPQATGDVDDITNMIIGEADGDSEVLLTADQDAALITGDSQALSDFANAYDETSI